MKNRTIHNAFSFAVIGALICIMSFSVLATDADGILDLNRTGSITVNMEDETDGGLSIYKISELKLDEETGNYEYMRTAEFADCNVDVDEFSTELASNLTEWIDVNGIEAYETENIHDGIVEFDDLELGMYFVIQDSSATGYVNINPFMVTVPMAENGAYIYEVNATPKVKSDKIDFTPNETVPEEVVTTIPDETVAEKNVISTVLDKLPQTGQLVWPIIAALFGGLLLIGIGVVMLKKKNGSKEESISFDV